MGAKRLFITGTDTGVGKTHVACWMARQMAAAGVRVGLYKPVCSGASEGPDGPEWEDVERLSAALDGRFPAERICPQRLIAPLAPPVAAGWEGRSIDEAGLAGGAAWWDGQVDALIVEGVGGWLSPISERMSVADLAAELGAPVLVVAANRLGVINQSLLTMESIRARGLPVAGVILNQADPLQPHRLPPEVEFDFAGSNLAEIERRGRVRAFGVLTHGGPARLVRSGQEIAVDWSDILATF